MTDKTKPRFLNWPDILCDCTGVGLTDFTPAGTMQKTLGLKGRGTSHSQNTSHHGTTY